MADVRVLIADDDAAIAELMLRRLAKMGLQADRAEDGEHALRMLDRTPYDLILTDIYMPGATGLDILRRAKEKDPHVQVVIVTGSASLDTAVEALNMGAFSYLAKPFDHVSVFDNAVSRALEFRRLIRDNQRLAEVQRRRGDLLEAEVTERIRQMRRKQQDLVDLLARLPQGVLVLDAEGRTTLSNPLAEEWLARDARDPGHPLRTLLSTVSVPDEPVTDVIDCAGTTLRVTCHALPAVEGKARRLVLLEETVRAQGRVIPELAPVVARLRPAIDYLVKQPRKAEEADVLRVVAEQLSGLEEMAGLASLMAARPGEPEQAVPLRIDEAELDAALAQIADVPLGAERDEPGREQSEDETLMRARDKVLRPPVMPPKAQPVQESGVPSSAASAVPEAGPAAPAKPVRKGLTSRLDMFRQAAAAKRATSPSQSASEKQPVPSPEEIEPLKQDEIEKLEALFQAAVAQSSESESGERTPAAPPQPRPSWPPPLPSQSNGQ